MIAVIETFLVKHAVGGRTLIDTGKSPVEYLLKQDEGQWVFHIRMPQGEALEQILTWKKELNVFVFREMPGEPTVKSWFYVGDGPVTYDAEQERLTIHARSRIDYVPDLFC